MLDRAKGRLQSSSPQKFAKRYVLLTTVTGPLLSGTTRMRPLIQVQRMSTGHAQVLLRAAMLTCTSSLHTIHAYGTTS